MYTVIPNPNATAQNPPSCQNVTYPSTTLSVNAAVINGAFSQYGWVPQVRQLEIICISPMNMRFVRRALVYRYPGRGNEWLAAVYADGTYLISFHCLVVTQKKNRAGGTNVTYALEHHNE